jgi:hypothetical protein
LAEYLSCRPAAVDEQAGSCHEAGGTRCEEYGGPTYLPNFPEPSLDWSEGVPLALGSAAGAYLAALLASREWAKVWVYHFLIVVVVLSIIHLLMVDSTQYLKHT